MTSEYQKWLSKFSDLYFSHNGRVAWRLYNHALIPATIKRVILELDPADAKRMLKESRALFIRYSSEVEIDATSWWYIYCDNYCPALLSGNTRSKLNRGRRRCVTRKMSVSELKNSGYEVYKAAFSRYAGQAPLSKERYGELIWRRKAGPFDIWGVWVSGDLAGYIICAIEDDEVFTEITRLHPGYLKHYTSYALFDAVLSHYVNGLGKVVNNGSRSVYHKTNMQQFLLKLGYRKQPCSLVVHYSLFGKLLVYISMCVHPIAKRYNNRVASIINGVVKQERIRRCFL